MTHLKYLIRGGGFCKKFLKLVRQFKTTGIYWIIFGGAGAGPKWRLRLQPNTLASGGSGSETLVRIDLPTNSKSI